MKRCKEAKGNDQYKGGLQDPLKASLFASLFFRRGQSPSPRPRTEPQSGSASAPMHFGEKQAYPGKGLIPYAKALNQGRDTLSLSRRVRLGFGRNPYEFKGKVRWDLFSKQIPTDCNKTCCRNTQNPNRTLFPLDPFRRTVLEISCFSYAKGLPRFVPVVWPY